MRKVGGLGMADEAIAKLVMLKADAAVTKAPKAAHEPSNYSIRDGSGALERSPKM